MRLEVNRVSLRDRRGVLRHPVRAAVVCDVHDGPYAHILPLLEGVDMILIPGDLTNRHDRNPPRLAGPFLRACVSMAPTWYSIGNHERRMPDARSWREIMDESGAHILDNRIEQIRGDLWIGGLSSQSPPIDGSVVSELSAKDGYRLLLCHHPEYFQPLISAHAVDLTLAGHAHGGQWRPFGIPLFAPGQGIFPRLTSGLYFDDRLLVSRGTGSHGSIPRLWNPCELILLTIEVAS